MLRPATPLSILMGAAFVLLLLSVLSVPIIKGIPLGTFKDVAFGVFGTCSNSDCSDVAVGYPNDVSFSTDSSSFSLSASTRHTVSPILIVHPVAALLTLILFIMSVVSHIHSASHSSRYLLVLWIFIIIDFLISLLAFIIDLLLFLPHLAFGTYLVLVAVILLAISAVIAFAMRRAVVGRKARQKRVAQNAEMSGENYYNREGQQKSGFVVSEPQASGANGGGDNLPSFATYENSSEPTHTNDEQIPLTSTRAASTRASDAGSNLGDSVYGQHRPRRSASLDRYGNPMGSPASPYGQNASDQYAMRRTPSREAISGGRGGRGDRRGGYGRGGANDFYEASPRDPRSYGSPGQGAYSPQSGRGSYGMRGGRGRPPPSGYAPMAGSYNGRSPPPNDGYGSYGGRPSDQPPPFNSRQNSDPSMRSLPGQYESYHNTPVDEFPRVDSPPPLPGATPTSSGHEIEAIEMDAIPRSSAQSYTHNGFANNNGAEVAGTPDLQQGPAHIVHEMRTDSPVPQTHEQQYAPPQAMWNEGNGWQAARDASPHSYSRQQQRPQQQNVESPRRPAMGSQSHVLPQGEYFPNTNPHYESRSPPPLPQQHHDQFVQTHPQQQRSFHPPQMDQSYYDGRPRPPSNGRARSPSGSDRSNFTSISQRGVNPRWQANRPPAPNQGQMRSQRQEVLLDNPGFQLSGGGARPRGGPGSGMIPESAYPTGRI